MSGIYPRIFIRIDSLFKAGEGTLDVLTETLRDVKATPWKAAHGATQRFDKFSKSKSKTIEIQEFYEGYFTLGYLKKVIYIYQVSIQSEC